MRLRLVLLLLSTTLLAGCGLPYYSQAVWGHGKLLLARRAVEKVVASPETDPETRRRLELLVRIRDFASSDVGLPENASFRRFVDLDRSHVVWNVIAAPELSTQPVQWCFPVAGCVAYRGYFSEERAEAYAATLRADGLDTQVYGVAAYSTLGWFADPALSTFLEWSEPDLAELVFHELAHQRVYVKDDTTFNESFATFVAEVGVERWLRAAGREELLPRHLAAAEHREEFAALVGDFRERLQEVYDGEWDDETKRARKREIFGELRAAYEARTGSWSEDSRYDAWFAQELNNAHLAAVGSYRELVPAFRELYRRSGSDLEAFYREAQRLGEQPLERRAEQLAELALEN